MTYMGGVVLYCVVPVVSVNMWCRVVRCLCDVVWYGVVCGDGVAWCVVIVLCGCVMYFGVV